MNIKSAFFCGGLQGLGRMALQREAHGPRQLASNAHLASTMKSGTEKHMDDFGGTAHNSKQAKLFQKVLDGASAATTKQNRSRFCHRAKRDHLGQSLCHETPIHVRPAWTRRPLWAMFSGKSCGRVTGVVVTSKAVLRWMAAQDTPMAPRPELVLCQSVAPCGRYGHKHVHKHGEPLIRRHLVGML
jgi:hypothetical protein